MWKETILFPTPGFESRTVWSLAIRYPNRNKHVTGCPAELQIVLRKKSATKLGSEILTIMCNEYGLTLCSNKLVLKMGLLLLE